MNKNVPVLSNLGCIPNLECEYPHGLSEMGFGDHSEIESPNDDVGGFSNTVLKYIDQILMEEDMNANPCMFHDPLALQATEKSLYEAINGSYPISPDRHPLSYSDQFLESPEVSFVASAIHANPILNSVDGTESESFAVRNLFPGPNSISGKEFMLQFKRGLEEGNKFLPKTDRLAINLSDCSSKPSPNELRERKNHERDEAEEEADFEGEMGRRRKQFAACTDESEEENELSELFDKVLLCDRGKEISRRYGERRLREAYLKAEANNKPVQPSGRLKKLDGDNEEVVDLRTLLISCAQAVSERDFRAANDLLMQIRRNSSPLGDGAQRAAHCFANGLEARLAGTGSKIYASLANKRTSAADMLKAYQAYNAACPFKKISIIFANWMILKTAACAEKLHVIDFGILYGFQWPAFLYYLSKRSCGPPKLRITGVEPPQRGFRPAERLQQTGARLARYCARFGVPFKYEAVAKKFEDVRVEDLRVARDEMLAVTCLLRFKNLLDETVVENNPRDAVLHLIRRLNPDIFLHSVSSGSSVPFFVPRFREALFNFSALFDLADATLERSDTMRLMYEREFLGREVINVVACEGSERVERPESYKQWQVRTVRAGFRPIPLHPKALRMLKEIVRIGYHSDFTVEEDGNWMLQGWKGRVLYACSCWVPV